MWALAALKPLTSSYLLQAVRIDARCYYATILEPGITPSPRPPITASASGDYVTGAVAEGVLQELCANILTLDSTTGEWTFSHASASEYFVKHHFSLEDAHIHIGFTSLALIIDLSHSSTSEGAAASNSYPGIMWKSRPKDIEMSDSSSLVCSDAYYTGSSCFTDLKAPESDTGYSFAEYTLTFWGQHIGVIDKACSGNFVQKISAHISLQALRTILQKFLGNPNNSSPAYRYWREYSSPKEGFKSRQCYGSSTELSSLAMVHFGIFNLAADWWPTPLTSHDNGSAFHEPCSPSVIDMTVRNSNGLTLLHLASFFGHTDVVEALIMAGMDANDAIHMQGYDEGYYRSATPLSLACKEGFVEVCKVLVKHCDPNLPRDKGNPLLMEVTVRARKTAIFQCLLAAGANSRCDLEVDHLDMRIVPPASYVYMTVFAFAAWQGSVHMLRSLVENTIAHPPMRDTSSDIEVLGNAALFAASSQPMDMDTLRYLIFDAHVDPNRRYTTRGDKTEDHTHVSASSPGETIMLVAVYQISRWKDNVIDFLQDCGIDLSLPSSDLQRLQKHFSSNNRRSLLCAAVRSGQLDAVRLAVEQWGQDVNEFTENGNASALATAIEGGKLELIRYLLEQGASINVQVPGGINQGCNALMAAACSRIP